MDQATDPEYQFEGRILKHQALPSASLDAAASRSDLEHLLQQLLQTHDTCARERDLWEQCANAYATQRDEASALALQLRSELAEANAQIARLREQVGQRNTAVGLLQQQLSDSQQQAHAWYTEASRVHTLAVQLVDRIPLLSRAARAEIAAQVALRIPPRNHT